MEIVGFFMLLLLVIADIVRIFKDDEKFDGAMLFARPIVAFLGTSLCGASLGVALLWSAGWGFGGFITAMLISECVGDFNHSDLNTQLEYAAPAGNSSPHFAAPSGSFTFAMNVLSEQDACYNSATAINGVVYYTFSTGKKPIGYYEPVNNGSGVNIYRELDKGLIGYICGKDIVLSRQVMYDHACKIRNECGSKYPVKVPIPMTLKVAEINNGHIMEIQNYTWVGTCQQNEYAAAAAFVCLIYECLLYHELHDFYFQWDK